MLQNQGGYLHGETTCWTRKETIPYHVLVAGCVYEVGAWGDVR